MRIAVCLSGESRTFKATEKAFKEFFNCHDVDFFTHSWSSNTWFEKNSAKSENKCSIEELNSDTLRDEILATYSAKKILVEQPKKFAFGTQSQFYSMMVANHLKCEYEIANGFVYDLVIRARYDLIFPPHTKFEIPQSIDPFAIYATKIDYDRGFYPALFDRFIFGNSLMMDRLSTVYKYSIGIEKHKSLIHNNYQIIDAEMMLYSFCRLSNISIIMHGMHETFVRREAAHYHSIDEFDKIQHIDHNFFKR